MGCSEAGGPDTEDPLLTARVDGATWTREPDDLLVAWLTPAGYLFVGGNRNDSLGRARDGLGVLVFGFVGPGEYQLTPDTDDEGFFTLYNPATSGATNFFSTSGVLTVTDWDSAGRRVAGRFSFEAREHAGTREVTVTNGAFRVEYDTIGPGGEAITDLSPVGH